MDAGSDKSGLVQALRSACDDGELDHKGTKDVADKLDLPLREVEGAALEAGIVPARYSRNMGTIGPAGQRQLLRSRVAVIGLGGLGGHVVDGLARLGVGQIVGVDPDRFTEGNLNRQIFATLDSLGNGKAAWTAACLGRINPAVEFEAHACRFEDLDPEALEACSVVFDCLDTIPGHLALEALCAELKVPLVHGAIAGWAGQVAVVAPGSGLLGCLYGSSRHGLEERLGNLHHTAAVAANLMLARALPCLLGEPVPGRNTVRFFDLESDEWQSAEL